MYLAIHRQLVQNSEEESLTDVLFDLDNSHNHGEEAIRQVRHIATIPALILSSLCCISYGFGDQFGVGEKIMNWEQGG